MTAIGIFPSCLQLRSTAPSPCGIQKRASFPPIANSSDATKPTMNNSEKNRLATAVLDRWCSFQDALAGAKRRHPLPDFLSFADAARRYFEATRRDQLVRRDVAAAINGLTEFLRLERKRVPGRVLSEADRLECLFLVGFDPHFEGEEPPGL